MVEEKKTKKNRKIDVSKYIDLEPKINETKTTTAVITFGRFSPPTVGHEKLVAKLKSEARKRNGTSMIFTSHTFDNKKNPLTYDSKIRYLQKAFGSIIRRSKARTIIEVAKELSGKYDSLVVIVGSDRVSEFQTLLSKYNDKEYRFDNIEVISAGERDPDANDVSGMSASKLRSIVIAGDFDTFKNGLPTKLRNSADEIYKELRANMKLDESVLDERGPLSVQQRRQRGRTMRRYKSKIAFARKRAAKRKASPEKLKKRARKRAREIMKQRFLQGKKYNDMSPSQKVQIDKRLHRIPDAVISRIATRQLPQVRKAEMQRLARVHGGKRNESIDDIFETFLQERRECPPKRMHMAMTKEGKVKFDRRFKFFRKCVPETEVDENFILDAARLMESVESLDVVLENVQRKNDDPCWDDYVQLGTKMKNGKKVPNCVSMESSKPSDREEGTDSLVQTYKNDTPGQKDESYYTSEIPSSYGDFRKGSRVRFTAHSMDMVDDESHEGTVVGSNTQHLRVRDDDGVLFKVRHSDAQLVETLFTFTLDEMFAFSFLSESMLDRAVEAIRKHVSNGKSLEDVIWEFSAATGFKIPTKEIYRHYIKTYGNPKDTKRGSDKTRNALIRKYT